MIEYIYEGSDSEIIAAQRKERQQAIRKQANPVAWFMGRVQHKLTGHNSVVELRRYYLGQELGLSFHTDYQREYEHIYAIRGWVFQKDGHSIVIRISNEHRKSMDFYLVTEERADVEKVFNKEEGSVLGFNIYINKARVRGTQLKVEFETDTGYTSLNLCFEKNDDDESRNAAYFDKALSLLPSKELLAQQKKEVFSYNPLISVVVPLYNTPIDFLREMMDSVLNQSYSNVELCLADGSTDASVGEFINKHYKKDKRVIYQKLEHNGGISENTNAACRMATGDYIMLCDHDDVVMENACYEMVKVMNENPETDIIYTDEDKITMDGTYYFGPHYKPDFNLMFLRDNNYICHIFLVRKSIVDILDGPERKEYDGAQDFDFILRCAEKAKKIHHIPMVLYHWRCHPLSTAMNPESKLYAYEAGTRAIMDSYKRNHIDAWAEQTKYFGRYCSHFAVKGNPKVSVILWTDENLTDPLQNEITDYVRANTDYSNLEFVVVSGVPFGRDGMVPDAKGLELLNKAADKATGQYLLFLNKNTKFNNKQWLTEMLGICSQDEIGICGARVIDQDGWIYSCGQAVTPNGRVVDELQGWNTGYVSFTGRAESSREVSGVCLQGMLIEASVFRRIGGLEPKMAEVAAMDLCLKAGADSKAVIDVHVDLIMDKACFKDRQEGRNAIKNDVFCDKWNDFIKMGDPMYNPNF